MARNIATIAAVVLLAVAGYIVYLHVTSPGPQPLDAFRREAARLVADEVSRKIPIEPSVEGPVVFMPLAGDKGRDEVTWMLLQAINDSGRYNLIEPDRLREYLAKHEVTLEQMRSNPATVLGAIEALSADGLMTGKIIQFPAPRGQDRTQLTLSLSLVDKQGAPKFEEKYSASISPSLFSLSYWRAWIAAQSVWTRLFGWLLAILLTPAILMPAIRKLLTHDSNVVNLWLLIGLTVWSTFVAYFAVGLRIEGTFAGFALLLMTLGGAVYNYVAASAVEYYMR